MSKGSWVVGIYIARAERSGNLGWSGLHYPTCILILLTFDFGYAMTEVP